MTRLKLKLEGAKLGSDGKNEMTEPIIGIKMEVSKELEVVTIRLKVN